MTREAWQCRTCHRVVSTRSMSSEHDEAAHMAYRQRATNVITLGLAIIVVGLVLQLLAVIGQLGGR